MSTWVIMDLQNSLSLLALSNVSLLIIHYCPCSTIHVYKLVRFLIHCFPLLHLHSLRPVSVKLSKHSLVHYVFKKSQCSIECIRCALQFVDGSSVMGAEKVAFLCLKDEAAKSNLEPQLHTWDHPNLNIWVTHSIRRWWKMGGVCQQKMRGQHQIQNPPTKSLIYFGGIQMVPSITRYRNIGGPS